MFMHYVWKMILFVFLAFLTRSANALLLPGRTMLRITQDIIKGADLICTGVATNASDGGTAPLHILGSAIDGYWKVLDFKIESIIKGKAEGQVIKIRLFTANDDRWPFSSIPLQKRSVLFLKKGDDNFDSYILYDPLRSAFLLSPKPAEVSDKDADIDAKLQAEFLKAIETGEVALAVPAIENLPGLASSLTKDSILALASLSGSTNAVLASVAIAARISLGDVGAIGEARVMVEAGKCPLFQYLDIRYALDKVGKDPAAVPELIKLLQSSEKGLRRTACRILQLVPKQDIELLLAFEKVLDDPDADVQFYAFCGLIQQTLGNVCRPLSGDFLKRREFYIGNLKAWWADNRERFMAEDREEVRQKAYEMLPWLSPNFKFDLEPASVMPDEWRGPLF